MGSWLVYNEDELRKLPKGKLVMIYYNDTKYDVYDQTVECKTDEYMSGDSLIRSINFCNRRFHRTPTLYCVFDIPEIPEEYKSCGKMDEKGAYIESTRWR